MAPFRPTNLNKRIVSDTGGNGGVVGPTKRAYVGAALGCRCFFGCCTGRFNISESFCGVKEFCACPEADCKGFFYCCGPSTAKWFVSPSCTGINRTWYCRADGVTVANSCMGSCGWFVPSISQLQSAAACRSYWDSVGNNPIIWSDTAFNHKEGFAFYFHGAGFTDSPYMSTNNAVRTIRCTAT